MTTTTIRRARVEDAIALTEIRCEAAAYKHSHGDVVWNRNGWPEEVSRRTLEIDDWYFIEQNGVPAGAWWLSWQDERHWGPQEPIAVYVHALALRKDCHGIGLGAFALDWCADYARAGHRPYLRLDCDLNNTKLCAYYESRGFNRVATKSTPEFGDYIASLYQRAVG